MSDIWELLKKMDCEECSVHDDCDNDNLCAEWITKAKPELLRLKKKAEKWDEVKAIIDKADKDALMDFCADNMSDSPFTTKGEDNG